MAKQSMVLDPNAASYQMLVVDDGPQVSSSPPAGAYRVTNLFAVKDPVTGDYKFQVEYDDEPAG